MKKGTLSAGIILLIIGFIGFIYPIHDNGYTIIDFHDLCKSGVGQLAQALWGAQTVERCQQAQYGAYTVYGLTIIGIILIIVGAVVPGKTKTWICEYCNFATQTEADMINHKNEKHLDKSPYMCGHCDFIGRTEEELWDHYNDKHPKEKKW